MARLKVGFSRLSILDQVQRARHVANCIEAHNIFDDASPTPAEIRAQALKLEKKFTAQAEGDRKENRLMHLESKRLVKMMNKLGSFVAYIADGDPEIILLSGLDVMEVARYSKVMITPYDLKLRDGNQPQSLYLRWTAVYRLLYLVEISENGYDENPVWTTYATWNYPWITITGLTSGKCYWVRVTALGPKGRKSRASTEVKRFVQ